MSNTNIKASDTGTVVAVIDPKSTVAAQNTDWIDVSDVYSLQALVIAGNLGTGATVDAKLEQAQDDSGTGAKDIDGKAITQLTKASNDNNQATINLWPQELDINNGFTHVRLTITPATAASLICGVMLAATTRYGAGAVQADSVVEVVGYGPPEY